MNPENSEVCNGIDDNCDGDMDGADAIDPRTWFSDSDGDGFGNPDYTTDAVARRVVTNALDCDDFNPLVSPFGIEMCDGLDDCNGETTRMTPSTASGSETWMATGSAQRRPPRPAAALPAVTSTTMRTATTGARQ